MLYRASEEVIEQYKESPNFLNLLQAFLDQYDDLFRVTKEIDLLTTLSNAKGENLDDLGDIIGYKRPYSTDVAKFFSFLGGAGLGFANVDGTVTGGEWYSLFPQAGQRINDSDYRKLLELKVKVNQSTGTPEEILTAVYEFTGTTGTIAEGTAEIFLGIIGASTPELRDFYSNFLPRPIGVKLTIEDLPLDGSAILYGSYTGQATDLVITPDNIPSAINVIQDPSFDDPFKWNLGLSWTMAGSEISVDGTQSGNTSVSQTADIQYAQVQVIIDVTSITAGKLNVVLGTTGSLSPDITAIGTYEFVIDGLVGSDGEFFIQADIDCIATVTSVDVRPYIPTNLEGGMMMFIKSTSATGNSVVVSSVAGVQKSFKSNSTDVSYDGGVKLISDDSFTLRGGNTESCADGVEYNYTVMPMTRIEQGFTSKGKPYQWYLNDHTGFASLVYQGAGADDLLSHDIPFPQNKSFKMISVKGLDTVDDFSVISNIAGIDLDINTDLPADLDLEQPILEDEYFKVKSKYNDIDSLYFGWGLMNISGFYTLSIYEGDGVDGRGFAIGTKPTLVMIKAINGVGDWNYTNGAMIIDRTISMSNSEPERTDGLININTSGFVVSSDSEVNAVGVKYLYIAIKQ